MNKVRVVAFCLQDCRAYVGIERGVGGLYCKGCGGTSLRLATIQDGPLMSAAARAAAVAPAYEIKEVVDR